MGVYKVTFQTRDKVTLAYTIAAPTKADAVKRGRSYVDQEAPGSRALGCLEIRRAQA